MLDCHFDDDLEGSLKMNKLLYLSTFFPFLFSGVNLCAETVIGEPIQFSAMADIPYDSTELRKLQQDIQLQNLKSQSEFLVHLGDIQHDPALCTLDYDQQFSTLLKTIKMPTLIIPGDNEWTDCLNPQQALVDWRTAFVGIENFWSNSPQVERQTKRTENFSFIAKGVLFIGVNNPGGKPPTDPSQEVWDQNVVPALQDDAEWVEYNLSTKSSLVRAAVIFSQDSGIAPTNPHGIFINRFRAAASLFAKPVLFLQGEEHVWAMDNPWVEKNILRVILAQGAIAPPIQVTVTTDPQNTFSINRNPFSNHVPIAFSNQYKTTLGEVIPISLRGEDQDNDPLTFKIVDQPKYGNLVGQGMSQSYIADSTFSGIDHFEYVVNDGQFDSDPQIITISVQGADRFEIKDEQSKVIANRSKGEHIELVVPAISNGVVKIFNMKGDLLKTILYSPNETRISWDGTNEKHDSLSSGTYMATIEENGKHAKVKIVLVR